MTVEHKNLLVELFVEELPPKALKKLGENFGAELEKALRSYSLIDRDPVDPQSEAARTTVFASPRRLAVLVRGVVARAEDRPMRVKLLPVEHGLKDGQPTPALLKRLMKEGEAESALSRVNRFPDGKGEALFLDKVEEGKSLAEGLQIALADAIAKLPIPKVMTYQLADGWSDVKFVRPAHGLVALYGAAVVPITALGLTAGRVTQGHRFESSQPQVELRDADSYAEQLRTEGAVIASFAERRAEIVRQLAAKADGLRPVEDDALLDEVTALVERPNVLACAFEPEYLAVPQECLILTMKANQKYFPLLDAAGKLTNRFLIVSNISPADPSAVIQGNERVVRPRLADAKFFFDQDRKKTLASRVPLLDKVVYHGQLGSQGERSERVRAIARAIAAQLGGDELVAQADTAAQLAKTDLLTDMVGEFPELQGVMGGYYARHDGLGDAIADAIEDHYRPRFAGDTLPRNEAGIVVALADKLETLVGLFGIGQLPTGDRDPFALRRHALGVIRILVERKLPLSITRLLGAAVDVFPKAGNAGSLVADFLYERLRVALRDQGFSAAEVDAVLALRPDVLVDVGERLTAVRAFAQLPEAASLAAANKRVSNILKKVDGAVSASVDPALLKEPAEAALAGALGNVAPIANALFATGEYAASLRELAVLKAAVDAFFDSVMVNADDPALRANRLGLLATLHAAMNRVADLSRLAT